MTTFKQQPIISAPGMDTNLKNPGSDVFHRVKSGDTNGAFSAVEIVTQPGQGVKVHVHTHEDELVYVLEGEVEVSLGDQKMTATAGVLAVLPRGIPHGFQNIGSTPSRIFDVISPGNFDNYFVELHNAYNGTDQADEATLSALAEKFSISYL